MRPCQMRFAATQRHKSALRADIGRSQSSVMFRKELRHQIQRQIMRADAENRPLDFSPASIQVDFDLLARIHALHAAGD